MAHGDSSETTIDGINYGPLAGILGKWEGRSGKDVAPEPDGDEHNDYYETIVFEAVGDVTNAEEQTFAVVRFHQLVRRVTNDKLLHDQVGYWLWDDENKTIVQTFVIPRGDGVVATGAVDCNDEGLVFEANSENGSDSGPTIAQAAFMQEKASTLSFSIRMVLKGDSLSYQQTSVVDIYGKHNYQHTDQNSLTRVA